MDTSVGKKLRFDINQSLSRIEKNTLLWGIFLTGLVTGFAGVYLVVAQPILAQLGEVQRQSIAMQNEMKALVGSSDQAWEASDLLSSLNAQRRQIQAARIAIKDIRQLRQDLQSEANHTAAGAAALTQLTRLQDALIEQREVAAQAVKALDEVAQVQRRLVKDHASTAQAEAALAGLDATKASLEALINIKQQILEGGQNVPAATISAGELVALKDQVISHGGNTAAAKDQVDKLFGLQDQLSSHSSDFTPAYTALDGLLEIKTKLLDQTPQVADAMQNLEILSDFQDEFGERIRSLGAMQHNLMEIVMMETTVARVAKVIEPLLQISNVRRLGDGELRDAARMILEKRSATRISRKGDSERHFQIIDEDPFKDDPAAGAPDQNLVPVPLPLSDE